MYANYDIVLCCKLSSNVMNSPSHLVGAQRCCTSHDRHGSVSWLYLVWAKASGVANGTGSNEEIRKYCAVNGMPCDARIDSRKHVKLGSMCAYMTL